MCGRSSNPVLILMKNKIPSRSLKILMLAPEPFFQPRGTPISIYFRLKALSDLGHRVDLITYHLGEDKHFPNVKIFRIPDLFGIKRIKIGPSFTKLPLDILLCLKASWKMITGRYDLIFSHEEGGWAGSVLARTWRVPHVYDMHSSLPQQLNNYEFTRSSLISWIFQFLERMVLSSSAGIIVICPDLRRTVIKEGFEKKTVLLENFIDFDHPNRSADEIRSKKILIAPKNEKIILYAGNFQPYQGILLLLEALAELKDRPVKLLLVGSKGEELESIKNLVHRMDLGSKVFFTGQVPPSDVPLFINVSDAVVSPRISGTNTPLKIYSFLKSGKPLVATKLWTHTQVLNEKIAILVEPDAKGMAAGIHKALFQAEGQKRAHTAKAYADREFTYSRYQEKITMVLEMALGKTKS